MTRLRWRFEAGHLALLAGASVLTSPPVETAKRFVHVIAAVGAITVCLFACSRQESALAPASPAAWTLANPAGTLDLLGVQLTRSSEGWAVGDIDPRGTGGAVFRTADAGRTWTPMAARSEVFTSVHFITPLIGWIAGHAGRVDRTDDGGRSWRSQRREAGREILNAVWAVDDRHVWAVGVRGLIVRTIDGGDTWAHVPPPVHTDLWAVKFVSPRRGWIVGDAGRRPCDPRWRLDLVAPSDRDEARALWARRCAAGHRRGRWRLGRHRANRRRRALDGGGRQYIGVAERRRDGRRHRVRGGRHAWSGAGLIRRGQLVDQPAVARAR